MFAAFYEKQDDWWTAYVEEISGVNTQGAAKENLREALGMVLQANRDLAPM